VPDTLLYRVLDAARFAPSGGNRQPWRVIVVKDKERREKLRDAYKLGWREYSAHVEQGLVPFAPGDDNSWDGPAVDLGAAREIARPNEFADNLDSVPVLLVLCARLAALAVTDNGLGRQSIVGGASVYPFSHNILLAARDEGLGGVMTTVICREEDAVRRTLDIPPHYAVAGLLALGHPVRTITKLKRLSVGELATVDSWTGDRFGARLTAP
ncbi:MAG: nitroreductase family protein, partial [Acidimicrobiales bacterium]